MESNSASPTALRIALLASFTAKPIADSLTRECRAVGIEAAVYEPGYQQYAQEILNPESALYQSDPQLIFLFLDSRGLLGEHFFHPYRLSDEKRQQWATEKLNEIASLVQTMKRKTASPIVLHNFEVPTHSPLGILESKQGFGFHESLEWLNSQLRGLCKEDPQLYLFDFNAFCSRLGKDSILDHKLYYLGDIKLHPKHLPALCQEYLSYIRPLLARTKKCLVLDLDNTLWGGIVGEEGLEGIQLGPTPAGRPFWELQKYLLALFERGVILAINSKNNPEDVAEVFQKHPHMILKEEHFAASRTNWEDKVSNMRALAQELNIGLESLVFVDDDKVNQDMMRQALPEVAVLELPADPALYLPTLMELRDFDTLSLTEEDRSRGKMYVQEKKRRMAKSQVGDLSEYLRKLGTTVSITRADPMSIPRIAQLTQKTNQFTMTTRRYTPEEVTRMADLQEFLVWALSSKDTFGEHGMVGVAIVQKGNPAWRIDSFLLSCRVIGRHIEEALLAYVLSQARAAGAKEMIGEFIPTKKNVPAQGFYERNGFTFSRKDGQREYFTYNLARPYPVPDCIAGVNL